MKKSFVILGSGNMTSALFAHGGPPGDFLYSCYTPSQTKASELALKLKGELLTTLDFKPPHFLFLGHKPQDFKNIAKQIKKNVNNETVIVSIQAAISTTQIKNELGINKVIRLMPNTPVSLKAGVVLFYATAEVSKYETDLIENWLEKSSVVTKTDSEEVLDNITVITGSGPGLIFEFGKIFSQHLIQNGLSEKEAQQLVAQTFLGSSLMMKGDLPLSQIQDQVTSKNGVTAACLKSFRDDQISNIMQKGFDLAIERGREISSSLNQESR
jgi:pyrroline-5-carboxylate reductase